MLSYCSKCKAEKDSKRHGLQKLLMEKQFYQNVQCATEKI